MTNKGNWDAKMGNKVESDPARECRQISEIMQEHDSWNSVKTISCSL